MLIKRFIQDLNEEFSYEKEAKYQVPYSNGSYYNILTHHADIGVSEEFEREDINTLMGFFSFYFEYSIFSHIKLEDKKERDFHLARAVYYSDIALLQGSNACKCLERTPYIISNKATFIMSLQLLVHRYDAFKNMADHLIDSLNGDNCIIKKGYRNATISWFLLKLCSLYSGKEITLHKSLQPNDRYGYDKILNTWNSEDTTIVLKNIDILCDLHLVQAELDLADADLDDDIHNVKYRELFLPALYIFPFEVITWLKLRELKGLKSPTEFSHPLMNTPIAKMFLDLKEPLPKPKDLPYARELLVKLKEKCPNIEIADWV